MLKILLTLLLEFGLQVIHRQIRRTIKNLKPHLHGRKFWRGLDESGTRTKKIVLITHLHVLFSTVLNDVKL